jgi:hypothetical protein
MVLRPEALPVISATSYAATMTSINRGLDLSNIATATDEERSDFRRFYDRMLGRGHPGLEFFLNNAPDAMKRYRAFADSATPRNLDTDRRVGGFGFMTYYALTGYVEGVRYLVYIQQQLGLTRTQVMEGLAIAFLHAGPRGSETIAKALEGYEWIEPTVEPEFPAGWAPDPEAFRSGLDFGVKDLSPDELERLEAWYERTLGEVPRYVRLMARHNPVLLKAYRHRFETVVHELPKQVVPASLLHYNVSRAHGPGIRENVLLARGFGMSLDDTWRSILSPSINAGMETLSLVDEVAGDILDRWDG